MLFRSHARKLIAWVKTTPKWPKYIVHGATITTEQGNGLEFCCNEPNQCCDSHTSRLAAVEALYFAKTGDAAYREEAYRSWNWVTYFQGLSSAAHSPFAGQWWFTDEFADGPRRMMDAFWAVPEWAPADESHLLGSSSVVTHIHYGKGSVTYSTFDPASSDVLRLDFAPEFVTANGRPLIRRRDLDQAGFTFDDATHVLRIRHDDARDVDVQGRDGSPAVRIITFDDPHLPAGTALKGVYPSGAIDWGEDQWRMHVPQGGFGTFNLSFSDPKASGADFRFDWPRIFVGVDVYNDGAKEASITIRCPQMREVTFTVKPGELRRLRTDWQDPSSRVFFDVKNGEGLLFDNLAYRQD